MAPFSGLTSLVDRAADSFDSLSTPQKVAVGVAGAGSTLYLLSSLLSSSAKPATWQLTGGSIAAKDVDKEFKDYSDAYGSVGTAEGIKDRSKTVQLVDVFYSLVTDIYEWGWGQSFHFSPKLPGKGWAQSEAAHEARICGLLRLKPGMKVIDCGCGVGGPMRTIAAASGAHVTGLTINQYQVDRATTHNDRNGLSPLTKVVRGDFTNMPFEANTFDAAYAIEATCHAPKLEDVYGEAFRVLKPGSFFLSYEWVSTKYFDPANPEHVKIIDEINYGNGLPEMRTWKQAEQAGLNVGFELVMSFDLGNASPVCRPWYTRLSDQQWRFPYHVFLVNSVDFLGIAPKGLKKVHDMLVSVAYSLIAGGKTGVFTPMHCLVFQKPK